MEKAELIFAILPISPTLSAGRRRSSSRADLVMKHAGTALSFTCRAHDTHPARARAFAAFSAIAARAAPGLLCHHRFLVESFWTRAGPRLFRSAGAPERRRPHRFSGRRRRHGAGPFADCFP